MSSYALSSESREEKVIRYLPLVRYIAGRVMAGKSSSIDMDDLINYGVIGLIDAIDRFDISKGVKFETYATLRIKGAIIDELRKLNWMPRTALGKITAINEMTDRLREKLGREPSDNEVAGELGISFKELKEAENYVNYLSFISLDEIIFKSDDDEISLSSMVEDNNSPRPDRLIEDKERHEILKQAIEMLDEKDKTVLNLYYNEKLTLKEIGHVLNVSESRVSQLHSRVIIRLRENLKKLHY